MTKKDVKLKEQKPVKQTAPKNNISISSVLSRFGVIITLVIVTSGLILCVLLLTRTLFYTYGEEATPADQTSTNATFNQTTIQKLTNYSSSESNNSVVTTTTTRNNPFAE